MGKDMAEINEDMTITGKGFKNFPVMMTKIFQGAVCMGIRGAGEVNVTLGDGTEATYVP